MTGSLAFLNKKKPTKPVCRIINLNHRIYYYFVYVNQPFYVCTLIDHRSSPLINHHTNSPHEKNAAALIATNNHKSNHVTHQDHNAPQCYAPGPGWAQGCSSGAPAVRVCACALAFLCCEMEGVCNERATSVLNTPHFQTKNKLKTQAAPRRRPPNHPRGGRAAAGQRAGRSDDHHRARRRPRLGARPRCRVCAV